MPCREKRRQSATRRVSLARRGPFRLRPISAVLREVRQTSTCHYEGDCRVVEGRQKALLGRLAVRQH